MKSLLECINEELVNEGQFSKGDLQNWDIIRFKDYHGYYFYLGPDMVEEIEHLCNYDSLKRVNYKRNGVFITPEMRHYKPCALLPVSNGLKKDLTNRDPKADIVEVRRANFDESSYWKMRNKKDKNGWNMDWQQDTYDFLTQYIPVSNSPSEYPSIEKAKFKSTVVWTRE